MTDYASKLDLSPDSHPIHNLKIEKVLLRGSFCEKIDTDKMKEFVDSSGSFYVVAHHDGMLIFESNLDVEVRVTVEEDGIILLQTDSVEHQERAVEHTKNFVRLYNIAFSDSLGLEQGIERSNIFATSHSGLIDGDLVEECKEEIGTESITPEDVVTVNGCSVFETGQITISGGDSLDDIENKLMSAFNEVMSVRYG